MSLPRYQEYKDCGIGWLGPIPRHWQVRRLKFLFDLMRRPVRDDDEIVTAFRDGQVTLRTKRRRDGFTNALQEIGYQGVRDGDLVIHAMDAFSGAIGVSDSDGKSTPVYSVCSPRGDVADSHYYAHLLRHMALGGFINSLAKGIRERSTDFRWSDAGPLFLPLPPLLEQRSIIAFLDRETAKIDALIAEQEKLLALLAEKRQATISHAVTRGLDPNAPMKDSGIPWLGEVPAHWETVRLRHLARLNPSKTEVEDDGDPDVSFLPMEAIGEDGSIRVDQERPLSQLQNGYSYFRNGDVVVAKITPCFENGKGALISDLPRGYGFGTTELIVVRSVGCLRPAFLSLVLSSSLFRKLAEGAMYGAGGQKRVPDEFVREFTVCVAPVEEQDAIWEELAKQTALLRSLELQSISAIALLKERRSALIAAAVTGQIDVRGFVEAQAV